MPFDRSHRRSVRVAVACLAALCPLSAVGDAGVERGPHTVSLMFENDLFGDSDRQYTNGIKLSWMSPDLKRLAGSPAAPGWLLGFVQHLNAFEHALGGAPERQFNVGLAIGQKMFTPDDTQATGLVVDDRPYAGWLYGALSFVSRTDRVADTLEIQLGMVGDASLAEDAQKFVHDVRDLPQPRGWDNQLDDEPGLVLFYERKWRVTRREFAAGWGGDLIAHTGVALGNVYDYLAAGAELRLGWRVPRDFGTSLIRPGGDANAPGTGAAGAARSRELGIYGFAAVGGRLIGRDIFLDGNTFSDSHDVDKHPLVGDVVIGASIVYGAAKLAIEQGRHPAALKDQVTSPGGTTIAGVERLEAGGLRAALHAAVQRATERSRELAKES